MATSPRNATLLGLVAILFWSTSVGIVRSTIEALGPVGAPAVLYSVSALLLWPKRVPLSALPRGYLAIGTGLFVAYQLCFVLALGLARSRAEAIEVSMANYLWPSLTVVFAAMAARQRLNAPMLLGLAVATAGVVAASSPPEGLSLARFFDNAAANPQSYGLALGAAVVWALYSTLTRQLAQGKSGLWFFVTASAVAFWLLYAAQAAPPPMQWSPRVLGLVAVSALSVTLAYAFWNAGVLRGHIQLLGLAANATPLLSALFASLLLGAPLSAMFWTGAALVALGSLIAGYGANQAQRAGQKARGRWSEDIGR